ncbi:hypothetical protein TRVL_10140 [Trypanosoma vivax]|nr:hypothetical protein TRVL_10140 [Trypanosoma vivax]
MGGTRNWRSFEALRRTEVAESGCRVAVTENNAVKGKTWQGNAHKRISCGRDAWERIFVPADGSWPKGRRRQQVQQPRRLSPRNAVISLEASERSGRLAKGPDFFSLCV